MVRLSSPIRYRTHSSKSRSPFAGHSHDGASSARISCSTICRRFISSLKGRLRGGNPTLTWKAHSSPRLARLNVSTRLTPSQQTKAAPDLLIISSSKQRPRNRGSLAIDTSSTGVHSFAMLEGGFGFLCARCVTSFSLFVCRAPGDQVETYHESVFTWILSSALCDCHFDRPLTTYN